MGAFKTKWGLVILCLIGAAILALVFILLEEKQTGEVIYSETLPGIVGETNSIAFDLKASEFVHTLTVEPEIESGWGEPDVFMALPLYGPDGEEIISVDSGTAWGGPVYNDSSRVYKERWAFEASAGGAYSVETTVLSEHVGGVDITIGQRSK